MASAEVGSARRTEISQNSWTAQFGAVGFGGTGVVEHRGRWILTGLGVVSIVYAVAVLGFVATAPDLRLRCLLIDESPDPKGVQLRGTPGIVWAGSEPHVGDTLLRIGPHPTPNFYEFAEALIGLRDASTPPGGLIDPGTDIGELSSLGLPWLIEENGIGERWVEIEYTPVGEMAPRTTRLLIQPIPLIDVVLTFVWLVFQLAICGVAALATWHRPFDRGARLFLAMSTVTLGAFVGGYHWHTIAGNLWLSLPLIFFSALLPAITLHFFLVYPRPKTFLVRRPKTVVAFLYALPTLAILGVAWTILEAEFGSLATTPERALVLVDDALSLLRSGVYTYLGVGAGYFALTLWALFDSQLTTRNPLEHMQVKWILRAGLVAGGLVIGTLYMAWSDRVGFALGRSKLLLFLASVSLMLAYAVAIVRHKLMLLDQIVSKGVWYWVASAALTMIVALTIAVSSMLDQLLKVNLSHEQAVAATAVLMLAVALLLWLRDFGQQEIDRRFFREKYQLDRALQRMNRAIGHLGDQESLAQMMLGSCCDVLGVEHASLYLRSAPRGPFRLVAATGSTDQPLEFIADETLLSTLQDGGSVQRVEVSTRSEMSAVQNNLRTLRADLVHAVESSQGIDGIVALGEKRAGAAFTAEDVTYLHALTQITHVALQTARVRENLARLNEELQRKTEKLTDQGRQIAILQAELTTAAAEPTQAEPRPPEDPTTFRRDALRGNSPAILRVLETARKVASSESTVLVRGESGTGKELLAQVLHDNSPRRDGPMVRVHCAALSSGLLESELFGHVKGSFTGAHKDRVGRFEAANGGTLFLDEIGDISFETQIKLLRVLQERCFEPVGSTRTVEVDVRLVTATHQDLEALIAQGKFREDLYYRLNVISMTLPPLRERREDVLELSLFFLARSAARLGKRVTHLDEDALSALEHYVWPGNIRELENVIERAVVLADGDQITLRELPAEISAPARQWPKQVVEAKPLPGPISSAAGEYLPNKGRTIVPASASIPVDEAVDDRQAILDALRVCKGNKAHAARRLGIPRSTLFSRMKKFGIE